MAMVATRRHLLATAVGGAMVALLQGTRAQAQPAAAPYKLVMLGDSLTAGFGLVRAQTIPTRLEAALAARGARVRVVNAGASGETSADVLARLGFSVPADTGGVLIAVGGNDMLQGLPPRDLAANLRAMVGQLKARRIPVALAGMRASANLGAGYRREFDAVYPTVARALNLQLYPFLLDGVALNPALNQQDGIHPNAAGAEIIARRLAPFVVSAFGVRAGR
jgi:acyl-CoA thioesterase I